MATDPLHQFVIQKIIPLPEVAGMDFSFTNSSLSMMLAIVASVVLFSAALKKKSLVPGRLQVLAETIYSMINGLVESNIGHHGKQYVPFVFTLFMTILLGNLLGLVPWSFTYTSHIIVTAALAFMVFLTVLILGISRHGLHFFSLFVPSGVPFFCYPLLVPIEIVSYMARPITHGLRLFANMMAGHIMLKVFAGFSVGLASLGVVGILGGLIPMAVNSALIGFEFMIALLQAYVFAILACIYLKDTVEIGH